MQDYLSGSLENVVKHGFIWRYVIRVIGPMKKPISFQQHPQLRD